MSEDGKAFGQGILSVITNHIYWLAMLNFYFIVCNLLFLAFFLFLVPSFSNMVLYFLALIPTGPAITALFCCLNKLIREQDLSPTKDFFHHYKKNFFSSIKVWLPMLIVYFILVVDFYYFNIQPLHLIQVLAGIFLVALGLALTFSFYVFLLHAQFHFRVRDFYRLAVYYSFLKVKATTGNVAIVILTVFVLSITSDFLLLFGASVIAYLIALNSNSLRGDVMSEFIEKEEQTEEEGDHEYKNII
ncbi:LOW QUALITY PROTEIN: hypothetical protein JCM19045_4462 [Bacillus sp. JCM 19045]|nr:LOW QUALITY PROTEIN: hypothetical protein JCM19045_4462 [Bacillus sp. JCM 19045]